MFLDGPSFVDYWRKFRGRTMRVLALLPAENLEWTHAPGKYTFGDVFRHLAGIERYAMVEHEAHHRGQIYLMAGMRGISVPPLYGLPEEEVLALSGPAVGE